MRPHARHTPTVGLALLALACAAASLKDIDPKQLAITDCPSDPGCPAAVLLDETELSNAKLQARLSRRRVVKLFTAEGVQQSSDVEVIETPGTDLIKGLTGRTILPDGKVIPLKAGDLRVKTVLKKGRRRQLVKTVKFPGVVPGAVIEYAYDVVDPRMSDYVRYNWEPQDDLPVLDSRLVMKQGGVSFSWRKTGVDSVHVETASPDDDTRTFHVVDVPALAEEPMAPGKEAIRLRLHFFAASQQGTWLGNFAGVLASAAGKFIDGTAGLPEKVKALVAPSDPPVEKARKIYGFVQASIGEEEKRIEETEASKVKDAANVGEVLSRGYGNEFERAMLFLAMVKEAGLEAGILIIAGRGRGALDTDIPDENQFDSFAVTIKIGSDWTFYDPAARHCPPGMISAEKEGGAFNAIHIAPRKPVIRKQYATGGNDLFMGAAPYKVASIPFSAAAKNVLTREATAALAEDGSLDLEVSDQGSGLVDMDLKEEYETIEESARSKALLAKVREALPAATLESASFDDVGSFDERATIKYRLKVPGYATAAGDRMVLAPAVLEAGRPALFTAERRRTPVQFPHRQRTVERIVFTLPDGYAVDQLPKVGVVREGPLMLMTTYAEEEEGLVVSRRLDLEAAVWPAEDYAKLKAFFERVHEVDQQVIVLKRIPKP